MIMAVLIKVKRRTAIIVRASIHHSYSYLLPATCCTCLVHIVQLDKNIRADTAGKSNAIRGQGYSIPQDLNIS